MLSRNQTSSRIRLIVLFVSAAVFNGSFANLPDVVGQEKPALKVVEFKWQDRFVATSKTEAVFSLPIPLPKNEMGTPAAGKRIAVTLPEYADTQVHHMLYLPNDWDKDWSKEKLRYPVIVELTGNCFPKSGSTGKVEDAGLGFGISKGQFIWVTMPFISADHQENAVRWWGDEAATVAYIKQNLPRICEQYGGDVDAVFICGFSRGAIGVNYIGLYDDEIAKLWCGFITHDHYDGVQEWKGTTWGTPLDQYRTAAAQRLGRLRDRPSLVCQSGGTQPIADYLKPLMPLNKFTFLDVDTRKILGEFPNKTAIHPHTDRWLTIDSPQRRTVWKWVSDVLETSSKATTDD